MSFLIIDEADRAKAYEAAQSFTIGELEAKVAALDADLLKAVEQAGDTIDMSKVDVVGGATAQEKSEGIVALHSEQAGYSDALSYKRDLKATADRIKRANSGAGDPEAEAKPDVDARHALSRKASRNLWDAFSEHMKERGLAISKENLKEHSYELAMDRQIMNTLMTTDAGWPPESVREGEVILSAQRPIQVIDIVPKREIMQEAATYMEETTFTNAAAEVNEGASAPEATLALTERTEMVRKVAVSLPITEEQMDDVPEVEGYINQRLPFMLRQRVDGQLINGNGTAPNISGFLDRSGLQAEAFTRTGSALVKPLVPIHRLKTAIELTGRAMPNAVVMHHQLWEALALQETTAAGFYLGSPAEGFAMRIWGLPVVKSDHLSVANGATSYSVLMGDFMTYSVCRVRRDFMIEWGWSADDFLRGQQRMRGTARLCLVVYRPAAFGRISMPTSGSGLV